MAQKTIYFGRFISTPKPDELLIRTGAVLVDRNDGRGVIEKVDWTVSSHEAARSSFEVEAPVIATKDNGFFSPGFIGEFWHNYDTHAGGRPSDQHTLWEELHI